MPVTYCGACGHALEHHANGGHGACAARVLVPMVEGNAIVLDDQKHPVMEAAVCPCKEGVTTEVFQCMTLSAISERLDGISSMLSILMTVAIQANDFEFTPEGKLQKKPESGPHLVRV